MGLYRHREITKQIFTDSKGEFAEGKASEFWHRIGSGPFDPHSQKSTKTRHPLHRYLHRCIILSIGGRKDNTGVVSVRDLFHLHCLIDGIPCNLAYSLAKFFTRATGYGSKSYIFGGPYDLKRASMVKERGNEENRSKKQTFCQGWYLTVREPQVVPPLRKGGDLERIGSNGSKSSDLYQSGWLILRRDSIFVSCLLWFVLDDVYAFEICFLSLNMYLG
ncbi:hypothetical protein L1987_58076 [Smallanthus sonchifolius]|uniref:Uncharacterized protein n=1 Tax=Smallanthus sonchifolius TaxID=185202 RepID=A0ACB9DEK4_9ASTR|nr:hypothetical protein L1987_58076 [Smallanthus sonchifolius]